MKIKYLKNMKKFFEKRFFRNYYFKEIFNEKKIILMFNKYFFRNELRK